MNNTLWAPWRMDYIKSLDAPPGTGATPAGAPPANAEAACFLCENARVDLANAAQAAQHLLLWRNEHGLIVLNRYPYTTGHLLVAPVAHLEDLTDLTVDQQAGLMTLTVLAEKVVRLAFNPQGINIGINLGRCAGAGLPGHMHLHIVPRWNGDTNFVNVVGQVRIIPQALERSYDLLREALAAITGQPARPVAG